MRPVDLDALAAVAWQLDQLGIPYAFTGGVAIGFLVDHPHLTHLRPTGDVDAIAAVVTRIQHTALEAQLRQLGFHHDSSEGAPICRWLNQGTKVDIMPAKDTTGQMSNPWFEHALWTASLKTLRHVTARVVSATCFVATKLVAFGDRGKGDFYGSHGNPSFAGAAGICRCVARASGERRGQPAPPASIAGPVAGHSQAVGAKSMTSIGQSERATQARVVALFCDELKYRVLGDWTDREGNTISKNVSLLIG